MFEDLKFDQGKSRIDLVEPDFILEMGLIMEHGAKKYAPESWKTRVENPENRYYAAAMRHLLAYRAGYLVDQESGYSHLAHAACNLMFLHWFTNRVED